MQTTLTVPVYTERIATEETPRYWAASLFISDFERVHAREEKALSGLEGDLRRAASKVAASMRHDDLAFWGYCPELTSYKEKINVVTRKHSSTYTFFFVAWEALGRRLVLSPRLPNLVFEWARGVELNERASEVLNAYFRERERENDTRNSKPEDFAAGPGARLTHIKITSHAAQRFADESQRDLAHLGGDGKMSGAEELEAVGRCLNRRFPTDLHRAVLREDEVGSLTNLFAPGTKKNPKAPPAPVLLLGPVQVGKTAIIHEYLFRTLDAPAGNGKKPELWLLSPQRLISGMSFVGQWEERFLAVLKHATERKLTLVFEDLLGLYQAGRSRDSDLSVGHLLKVHLTENPLPIIAEATPESWAKVRETDRAFADLFHVIPVREPSERDILRTVLRSVHDIEAKTKVAFAAGAIPTAIALQRRFVRSRAFPGKAVEMLRHLAAARPNEELDSADVTRHFSARTGINPVFLDEATPLDPAAVRSFFNDRILGQENAVGAMVDAVFMQKARLNDPSRPAASFLFLGPTGVGKTECAKALAEYFFGSAEKITRFDMNEYGGPDASLRLIGAFGHPGGQLTGAIRRNPYSVLLLDEIEKANPEVFDLLLQVLGDGRLTDANGLTADFCNTVIVLTSNLGAASAGKSLGFAETASTPSGFREAAEKFFRPELFNRLDRVIAFHQLSRDHIRTLSTRLVAKVLERGGLSGRKLAIDLDPKVAATLALEGYSPEFGARALRRTVESKLVDPLALALTSLPPETHAFLHIREEGITTTPLIQAPRETAFPEDVPPAEAEALCEELTTQLRDLDAEMDTWDLPEDPTSPERLATYEIREQRIALRELRDHVLALAEATRKSSRPLVHKVPPTRYFTDEQLTGLLDQLLTASDRSKILATAHTPTPLTIAATKLSTGVEEILSNANIETLLDERPDAPPGIQLELSPALHADRFDATEVTHLHLEKETVDFQSGSLVLK